MPSQLSNLTPKPPNPAPTSTTITVKPATTHRAAKCIKFTDDLIKEFPNWFTGIGRFPGEYTIWLYYWCPPHHTCPQEMPHCLMSKGQGAPWQNGMHGGDHPFRPAHRLGVINHLCFEGKWWAMSVFRSLWSQWGHLPWSPQDTHCGGSCPWICTLPLLYKVGCPPWILINHPWSRIQPTLQKIPFPASSLWPCLFPRYLPEEDGPHPRRVQRMHWNHRSHHHPWSHQSGTWCPSMECHVCCPQVWVSVQPTENTYKGTSCQFLWLLLWCWWCPPRPRKGWVP